MFSLRTRLFIIISLGVLLILAISLVILINSKNKNNPSSEPTATSSSNIVNGSNSNNSASNVAVNRGVVPQGYTSKPFSSVEATKNGVSQLAKIFIERYNSYTSDSEFMNIKDIEAMVTKELWARLSNKIGKPAPATAFMSVSTQVISSEIGNWTDSAATVNLKTQIIENKNNQISSRYQGVNVFLTKEGENWLVNKFEWEK